MTVAAGSRSPAVVESFPGVRADGAEQSVAGLPGGRARSPGERSTRPRQHVEHLLAGRSCPPATPITAATSNGPGNAASRRNRTCSAGVNSSWLQSRVERRLWCRAGPRPARSARQQPEGVVEPGDDLLHREHAHAPSGQLDRQRPAREAATQLSDQRGVASGDREIRDSRADPLDEQSGSPGRAAAAPDGSSRRRYRAARGWSRSQGAGQASSKASARSRTPRRGARSCPARAGTRPRRPDRRRRPPRRRAWLGPEGARHGLRHQLTRRT